MNEGRKTPAATNSLATFLAISPRAPMAILLALIPLALKSRNTANSATSAIRGHHEARALRSSRAIC